MTATLSTDDMKALSVHFAQQKRKPSAATDPKLVEAGMAVQRLLVNNPRPVTAEDARALYRQVLEEGKA